MLIPIALTLSPLLAPAGEWSQETFEVPDVLAFYITGMNDQGDAVGWILETTPGTGTRAFQRSADASLRYYESLEGQFGNSFFHAISNSGEILGSSTAGPFTVAGGVVQSLPTIGEDGNYAGRNAAGLFVGSFGNHNNTERSGMIYDGTQVASVAIPGYAYTVFSDVNASGLVVGSCLPDLSGYGSHGLLYDSTTGEVSRLDMPGASSTFLYGMNDAGEVVGAAIFPGAAGLRAVHFDGQAWQRLEIFGRAGESRASDIDNTGRIVGTYQGEHLGQQGSFGFFLTRVGPFPFCEATENSSGSSAGIHAAGSTSFSANELVLQAGPAPANTPGLFFFGLGQQEVPFGDGFLCVSGPQWRLGAAPTDANGFVVHPFDVHSPAALDAGLGAGSRVHFQYWFRDPAAGGTGFNTSRGLTLEFAP